MLGEAERRMIAQGKTPVSRHPQIKQIEKILYDAWKYNKEISLSSAIKVAEGSLSLTDAQQISTGGHGDHWDNKQNFHADIPHGDSHGDHYDEPNLHHNDDTIKQKI